MLWSRLTWNRLALNEGSATDSSVEHGSPPVSPRLSDPRARLWTLTRWWSKPVSLSEPYPLLCHLLDTAAAADVLWRPWLRSGLRDLLTDAIAPGDPDLTRRRFALVAGLHDVGKANAIFQGQTMSRYTEAWADPFRQTLREAGYEDGPYHAEP